MLLCSASKILSLSCFLSNPTALFELTELLILLEPRTRLLHLSGLLSGLLLHRTWWKDRISGSCFPGEGVRLRGDDGEEGEGPRRQDFQVRGASREKWTRSWGYAGYRCVQSSLHIYHTLLILVDFSPFMEFLLL